MSQIERLIIGQKIWRFCNPKTFTFVVTCVRAYDNGELYEVECQQCEHGYTCKCLVAVNAENEICHVDFINNDPENSQRHWHNDTTPYFRTKEECTRYIGRHFLRSVNEEIDRLNQRLVEAKARKERYQALADTFAAEVAA